MRHFENLSCYDLSIEKKEDSDNQQFKHNGFTTTGPETTKRKGHLISNNHMQLEKEDNLCGIILNIKVCEAYFHSYLLPN